MAAISSAVMRVCMTAPTIGPSVVGPGFATLNARQEVACGLEPVPLRDIKFRFETYRLSEVPIPSRSAGPHAAGRQLRAPHSKPRLRRAVGGRRRWGGTLCQLVESKVLNITNLLTQDLGLAKITLRGIS